MNRQDFFKDRYGIDNLSLALAILSVLFIHKNLVWVIAVALIGIAAYRTLSKDKAKRLKELQWYNKQVSKIKQFLRPLNEALAKSLFKSYKNFNSYKTRYNQRKDFVFVKCSKCGNTLRLPRNKGKLSVTCPVCKYEFLKKT